VRAGQSLPDGHQAFPEYDANHGYRTTLPADPGAHRVCAYAITTGGGYSNPLLGCRDVTVS